MGKNKKKKKDKEKKAIGLAERVRGRVKTEVGYMGKGAKVLGRMAVKKGKAFVKEQVEAAKERARLEREAEKVAREAEKEAYREEMIRRAKARGRAKAKKGAKGIKGILAELGERGEAMAPSKILGLGEITGKKGKAEQVVTQREITGLSGMSSESYIFSGLGKPKKGRKGLDFGLPEGFEVESVTVRKKKKKKK